MIIVYPMLVSQAVSENAIPGIAKTLESFIIINAQNSIISNAEVRKNTNLNFKIKQGKLFVKESEDFVNEVDITDIADPGTKKKEKDEKLDKKLEDLDDKLKQRKEVEKELERQILDIEKQMRQLYPNDPNWANLLNRKEKLKRSKEKVQKEINELEKEIKTTTSEKEQNKKDLADLEKVKKQKEELEKKRKKLEKEKEELDAKKAKKASVSVKGGDSKTMSLDPTYITVEVEDKYGNKRNEFVGVKVMPLRIKSEAKLTRLILHDVKLKAIHAGMVSLGRRITRSFYRFLASWQKRLGLDMRAPTGDPRKDIIMGLSGHAGHGFVVLSKNEDIDEEFLSNIKNINRLFKMGWGNIVIVDDVNRTAYFCMKQFKGVCTAMTFTMMYNNFGQLKVYETLEDAKKQSSSIFKIKRGVSKVFSEWVVESKVSKYLREDYNDE
jgi:hypothetical protein